MSSIDKINELASWRDLTIGGEINEGGTAKFFKTGDWRVDTPKFIAEKCKQCLLCIPVCPDSAIPVKDKIRADFNFDHCKGCGVCAKVCPFGAIEMIKGDE